jgi:hypothetical protein
MRSTERVRAWLPLIAEKYGIVSLNDAGAGDLNWIQHVEWKNDLFYRSYDIFPRNPQVVKFDIIKETLPRADSILCRMVLNHLGQDGADVAIQRFRESGATYLIANRYDRDDREFHRVEIGWDPLEETRDGPEEGCYIGIWKL